MNEPSINGDNGRLPNGRFGVGNPGGPGNPHAKRIAEIRSALLSVCTPERMKAACEMLMQQAEAGDLRCFAELADRVIGKPAQAEVLQRIEALETLLAERQKA